MKWPTSLRDFVDQRRRIHAGHLRLARGSGHSVSTLSLSGIGGAIRARRRRAQPPGWGTVAAAAALEGVSRGLACLDARRRAPARGVWKPIASTKDLRP